MAALGAGGGEGVEKVAGKFRVYSSELKDKNSFRGLLLTDHFCLSLLLFVFTNRSI